MYELLKQIDKAVCLVLDWRFSMFSKLAFKLLQYNIHLNPFIAGGNIKECFKYDHLDINQLPPRYIQSTDYGTWWKSPNAYNAWLCHSKIMIKALNNGYDTLLLMEDDAHIENDFEKILEKITPFFLNNKWDMLYLGAYHNKTTKSVTENIVKLNGSAGWHAVIIKRIIMEQLINAPPLGPMDWMCGKYIHPEYDCYAIYPSIITQSSGYSYIEEGNLEKPSRYQL